MRAVNLSESREAYSEREIKQDCNSEQGIYLIKLHLLAYEGKTMCRALCLLQVLLL